VLESSIWEFLLRLRQTIKPNSKATSATAGTLMPMPILAPVGSPDGACTVGDGLLDAVAGEAEDLTAGDVVDIAVIVSGMVAVDGVDCATEERSASSELCHHTCTPSRYADVATGNVLFNTGPASQPTPRFLGWMYVTT